MTENEFLEAVRKKLLNEVFPGEHGRRERLPADYVETLLQKRSWDGTCTAIHAEFLRESEFRTPDAWIDATADYLWVDDNC